MAKLTTMAFLALLPLALGLRVPQGLSRRAVAFGAASVCLPSVADNEEAPLYDVAGQATERIRKEGLVKSTGKQVPGWLVGAIVVGAGAAFAINLFSSPKPDQPLPTGLFSEVDEEAYEESRWVNNVDLPENIFGAPVTAAEEAPTDADEDEE